ncbi:MAG: septum formation initiator family protein [Lachnospiraceae bacterium]|nr:septum formation initiator family protein [Lachnospiraceae bacterium]
MQRKSGKRKTGLKLLLVVVLVMCGVLTYSRGKAEIKEKELLAQKAATEQQLETEKARQEELKEEEAYRQTTQYKEELARDKMGLVYPDEIILREEEAE